MVLDLAVIPTARTPDVERLCRSFGRAIVGKVLAAAAGSDLMILPPASETLEAIAIAAGARCWNPELTYANDLARRGPAAMGAAVAQLVLAFVPLGLEGRFQVRLPYTEWLMLETNRLRCAGVTTIRVEAGKAHIACDDDAFSYTFADRLWRDDTLDQPTIGCGTGNPFLYVSGYSADPEMLLAEDRTLEAVQTADAHRTLDAAFGLVADGGDDCRAWVARMVSRITLVSSEGNARLSSRSVAARAGNVEIAAPGDILHVAELLVHEAAHQYFHLAQLYGAIVRPEAAAKLFYSAINGRQRPLERVALAYHAVANIFTLLDRLAARGGAIGEDARNRMIDLGRTERSLRRTLEPAARDLTPFGNEFCARMLTHTTGIVGRYDIAADTIPTRVAWGTG